MNKIFVYDGHQTPLGLYLLNEALPSLKDMDKRK